MTAEERAVTVNGTGDYVESSRSMRNRYVYGVDDFTVHIDFNAGDGSFHDRCVYRCKHTSFGCKPECVADLEVVMEDAVTVLIGFAFVAGAFDAAGVTDLFIHVSFSLFLEMTV